MLLVHFALYGVVAGAVLTGAFSLLNVRHSSKAATDERVDRAAQAALDRSHEIDMDRRRSIRAAREKTYPGLVLFVQRTAANIASDAILAIDGKPPLDRPLMSVDSDVKIDVVGADMMIFGTDRTIDAWKRYLQTEDNLSVALQRLRRLQAEHKGHSEDRPPLTNSVAMHLDKTGEALTKLLSCMREDLTQPEVAANSLTT